MKTSEDGEVSGIPFHISGNGIEKEMCIRDRHNQISEEIRETESTMSKFIEMSIREHYEKGANRIMEKGRTLAFQVSEELFQRAVSYTHLGIKPSFLHTKTAEEGFLRCFLAILVEKDL